MSVACRSACIEALEQWCGWTVILLCDSSIGVSSACARSKFWARISAAPVAVAALGCGIFSRSRSRAARRADFFLFAILRLWPRRRRDRLLAELVSNGRFASDIVRYQH
jgi:hypothetical protein